MTDGCMRIARRSFIVTLLCLSMLGTLARAKPGTTPGTQGNYDIIFAGTYKGDGKAVVTPNHVNIHGKLVNPVTGATANFIANNLPLDDGRFTGSGTVFGVTITVDGRAQAADGVVIKVPRVVASYTTSAGGAGRIAGEKKS